MSEKVRQLCWWVLILAMIAPAVWLAHRYYYDPQRVYDRNYSRYSHPIDVPYTNGGRFVATNANTNSVAPARRSMPAAGKLMAELTQGERAQFAAEFEQRYRPAIAKWAKAFDGHVPFDVDTITPDKAVNRVGWNPSHYEYIFVIHGITLGVADSKGTAQVDYLNARAETDKLAKLPDGSQPPTLTMPLTKQEIIAMVEADGGGHFSEQDIRLIPSGMSGSLNGGMFAQVGGAPRNSVTWKYNLVFGPDGNLAYYAR